MPRWQPKIKPQTVMRTEPIGPLTAVQAYYQEHHSCLGCANLTKEVIEQHFPTNQEDWTSCGGWGPDPPCGGCDDCIMGQYQHALGQWVKRDKVAIEHGMRDATWYSPVNLTYEQMGEMKDRWHDIDHWPYPNRRCNQPLTIQAAHLWLVWTPASQAAEAHYIDGPEHKNRRCSS